jgi:hypothetical protein
MNVLKIRAGRAWVALIVAGVLIATAWAGPSVASAATSP